MNAQAIREEIARLGARFSELDAEREQARFARHEALTANPFTAGHEARADAADRELTRIEAERARSKARITALREELPSEQSVREAQERVTQLRGRAEEELREFNTASVALWRKCEDVCEAAAAMSAARSELREIRAAINECSTTYGLPAGTPPTETCPTETFQLVGLLMMQVGEGIADENLINNVRSRFPKSEQPSDATAVVATA
jgi:chromosome segregation ATPase